MMLDRLARLAVTRPKTIVVVALVLLIAAAAYGSHVADRLAGGGFLSTSSESNRAPTCCRSDFTPASPTSSSLPPTPAARSVDDPDAVAAGQLITRQLADTPGVDAVTSYWSAGSRSRCAAATDPAP